ncbi:MAG: hypothetical protein J6S67_09130 [Methanobrevibacter sp.]|nr:hypothetical protein [Methanobrevibacter sp.]
MVISELNHGQKLRFMNRQVCPICKKSITVDDTFECLKMKRGRNLLFIFFHTKCLVGQPTESED